MLHNAFQFFFDHLYAWDHTGTSGVLIRFLGSNPKEAVASSEGAMTSHMDDKAPNYQATVQRLAPLHAAEQSLKALCGPDEQQWWPARPTFHKTWPDLLQAYQRVYEALGPHLVNEWPSLDDAENRQIIDNFRARVRRELSIHIQPSEVQTLMENEGCMSEPAWQGFYACVAYLRHYYRYVHPIPRTSHLKLTISLVDGVCHQSST